MKAFPSAEKLSLLRNSQTPAKTAEFIYKESSGMDLRDYFAAKAMQAIIESTTHKTPFVATYNIADNDKISKIAYELSEAMMKEREK